MLGGCLRPEMASSVDKSPMVCMFYSPLSSTFNRFDVISGFPIVGIGEMSISAARERSRLELTSIFDFFIRIWYSLSAVTFSSIS